MDIRHIEVGKKDYEGFKRNGKNKDNDETLGKMIKVNGKFAKASIRPSSSLNLMSMRYVKSKGLTWKQSNNDEDLLGFVWKNGKCCCMVRSNNDETMFVISEEPEIDENIIDTDYVIKENNSRRKSDVVDVRHISTGVEKNKCKTFDSCQKSEDKGDADEASIIGCWYHHRIRYEKNEHKTFSHYQKSAKTVDIDRMSSAEYCYRKEFDEEKDKHEDYHHERVRKDQHKATSYYQKSVDESCERNIRIRC
ncbi:hypothetical protein C2G38_2177318 [Gigaspora rosea]|uniref:Uncharacterized protein n=1 Tax=Gigaspora rosea TaxID=44941 RepID=A0A397VFF6_9GLOM|nr:hypothetical protein C2G38_2177318 [Gigaspora rosea]